MNAIARMMFQYFLILVFCSMVAFHAHAAAVYDETANGDLSDNNLSPTSIGLDVGQNLILGSTVHEPSLDRDFFTVAVDAGRTLNAVLQQLPHRGELAGQVGKLPQVDL